MNRVALFFVGLSLSGSWVGDVVAETQAEAYNRGWNDGYKAAGGGGGGGGSGIQQVPLAGWSEGWPSVEGGGSNSMIEFMQGIDGLSSGNSIGVVQFEPLGESTTIPLAIPFTGEFEPNSYDQARRLRELAHTIAGREDHVRINIIKNSENELDGPIVFTIDGGDGAVEKQVDIGDIFKDVVKITIDPNISVDLN